MVVAEIKCVANRYGDTRTRPTQTTTIIESKYSVTPEHAGFIRSMLLETEWRGGLFDVAQGNLETNLSQGAFGFFAISTVIRDTLTVK